jgi:outer membrane murein-binding lipoprotein Lpp
VAAPPDSAGPTPGPAAAAEPESSPAVRQYQEAQNAITAQQDLEAGIARLEQAVALDPGFAEAWYQLGTARLTAAMEARPVDPRRSLTLFRAGVAGCRRALALAQSGSLRVWDAFELADAVADLRETLDLLGDDARLADDAAARAALDRWAHLKGYTEEPESGDTGTEEKP